MPRGPKLPWFEWPLDPAALRLLAASGNDDDNAGESSGWRERTRHPQSCDERCTLPHWSWSTSPPARAALAARARCGRFCWRPPPNAKISLRVRYRESSQP